MSPAAAPLQGVGVLVTRPRHQAEALCELIQQQGGTAIRFPALDIQAPANPHKLRQIAHRLEEFDWAVFISANAVSRTLKQVLAQRGWPHTVRIAVIGRRSAEELERFGLTADLFPQQKFNTEALLALPAMQDVDGQRFVIFRGSGGRELLADELRKRGAIVEYVEAYRRACPRADSTELLQRWQQGLISIVSVTSAESLNNLVEMLGDTGNSLLTATPLLVVSERMLALAEKLGFKHPPLVAENATDEALVKALLAWKRRQTGP